MLFVKANLGIPLTYKMLKKKKKFCSKVQLQSDFVNVYISLRLRRGN